VRAADQKIEKTAKEIKNGKYPHDGIYFHDRMRGLSAKGSGSIGRQRITQKG